MGIATGTIKYTLFLFNTLWAIYGILIILFGAFGWDAMPQKYAIGSIVLGGVIFCISFFGCFGALRESARTLWAYVIFLLILLVLTITFMLINTRDVFKKFALQSVEDMWEKELISPGAMDSIHFTYSCCGRDGPEDYAKIGRTIGPPSSCCKDSNCINPLKLYMTGCLKKVEESFADEATTTQYYEWTMLGFNLIILLMASFLAIHFTNRNRRYNY